MGATSWNREQVHAICDEVKRIRETIPDASKSGAVPGERGRALSDALGSLAGRLGISADSLRKIYKGEVEKYRPWVVEWRQMRSVPLHGDRNGTKPIARKPFERVTDEEREAARKLHADGISISEIARLIGRPAGTVWGLVHPKTVRHDGRPTLDGRPANRGGRRTPPEKVAEVKRLRKEGLTYREIAEKTGLPTGTVGGLFYSLRLRRERLATAARTAHKTVRPQPTKTPATTGDLGRDFEAFLAAQEEAERARLAERHERERGELDEKLVERRRIAIERLVDFYTKPE